MNKHLQEQAKRYRQNCALHDKVYSEHALLSYPAQRAWICRRCGAEGVDSEEATTSSYEALKKQFNKQ